MRRGHRVTIACREASVLAVHAADAGAAAYNRFLFRGGVRPCAWQRDYQAARRLIVEESPDILHVNGSQDHWTLALANASLGRPAPLLRTRHNTYEVKDNLPNRYLNRRLTDFQIVVCETVRRALAAHPAFVAERLCSIHNGVDAALYRPDPEKRKAARAEFDCTDGDIACGIVARLAQAKGHVHLFEAVAMLKNRCPNLRILVFGQGVLEKPLRLKASKLGIAPMVRFLGFRNDMPYCVQALDIGVQPSVDCDTSSFSMKEQMAAAIPVIASDYGGLTEIISDGVEGKVTPAGAAAPLANALETLAGDPEMRRRMGQAGRARVLAEFSSDVFVERTLEVYRRILAAREKKADES